jgi:D-psicose/D-tagatose/L-ribulose 3-epimerase
VKIAISNLAWAPDDDRAVASLLVSAGVQGVELAPSKIWPGTPPLKVGEAERYAEWWRDRGLEVVALQGILFGRPELQLFGDPAAVQALQNHLLGMAKLAARLGARIIVLGAPGNRRRGALDLDRAIELAAAVLRTSAEVAHNEGCALCIEPAPVQYGCDFINTAAEGATLVGAVGHPGFRLHLDSAALSLTGEIAERDLLERVRLVRHFHASEVDLQPLGTGTVDHRNVGRLLRAGGYSGWCSVEMKQVADALPAIESACAVARDAYAADH